MDFNKQIPSPPHPTLSPVSTLHFYQEYAFPEQKIDPFEISQFIDLIGLVDDEDIIEGGSTEEIAVDCDLMGTLFKKVHIGDEKVAVARLTLIQDGGVRVNVHGGGDKFWEDLPNIVSIDDSYDTRVLYSTIYNCVIPRAVVEIGPDCVAPVFETCIEGVCSCVYELCGAVCQLNPCRLCI